MLKISTEDWREVFALLDTALDVPVAVRAAWLSSLDRPAHVVAMLRELLTRQTAGGLLQGLPQFTGSPDLPLADAGQDSVDVGSAVGPYRLMSRLGRGGMSTVWVAERIDGMLKRRVAVKLPSVSWAIPEAARRMERERELLSTLEHPNIARLYDAGVSEDGRPYLALELVDGRPIDEHCADPGVDLAMRVTLVLQTARAVAYAHSRSILHRDLKPSNILVDAGGQVHLLDFGIGKLLEGNAASATCDTQFANRLFTPDYASPEQKRGEPVTAASDVFSLGVVLYQVLSGQLPFAARDTLRGDLATIVLKALKEPEMERFVSMAAFADDLERYLRGEPVLARPDSTWYRLHKLMTRHRRVLRAAGASVAITAAIGAGLAVYQARQNSASTARALELSADAMAQRALPRSDTPRDVIAYREYLQARSLMLRPTEENLREIVRLAESSIARDADFAHAHALLAGASVLFLDLGLSRPGALTFAEPEARRALELNPRLPGAYATLGSIAAHRGQWRLAEKHFKSAVELDDHTGRIHARRAQMILTSVGRLELAQRQFMAEFRLTPGHARGAMQVATSLDMLPGHESEALKFVDIAISLGWPPEADDVRTFYSHAARRAGRYREAIDYQSLALPEAMRAHGGAELVALLHDALATPVRRESALRGLDMLTNYLQDAGTTSFASLMFAMNWYVMLGDLDRAFEAGEQWLQLSAQTGLSGIPHNAGFWLPEMRVFRADPRFGALAERMGLMGYWRLFGAPDHCALRERLICER